MLVLPVWPGLVSVFYFLFLDLILLSILDYSLSRMLSAAYHRRIQRGQPINISSCNVLGLTNFKLDRITLAPNLISVFVKLAFMGIIIALDLNIISVTSTTFTRKRFQGTFNYNATQEDMNISTVRVSKDQCMIHLQRLCRRTHHNDKESVTFYRLAYNFEDGALLQSEIANGTNPATMVEERSVVCMAPGEVNNPWELMKISGCSKRQNRACVAQTPITASLGDLRLDDKRHHLNFTIQYYFLYPQTLRVFSQDEVLSILPMYRTGDLVSIDMVCLLGEYRPKDSVAVGSTVMATCLTTRILTSNQTVIEWWRYDDERNEINSLYPGPVFEGTLDIRLNTKAGYLLKLYYNAPNYISLAALVVADALDYEVAEIDVVVAGTRRIETLIPTRALYLFDMMVVGVIGIAITGVLTASHRKVITIKLGEISSVPSKVAGKDGTVQSARRRVVHMQQINTINGFSDIVHRELFRNAGLEVISEHETYVDVGFSINKKGGLHFGPLFNKEEAVRLIDGKIIV